MMAKVRSKAAKILKSILIVKVRRRKSQLTAEKWRERLMRISRDLNHLIGGRGLQGEGGGRRVG